MTQPSRPATTLAVKWCAAALFSHLSYVATDVEEFLGERYGKEQRQYAMNHLRDLYFSCNTGIKLPVLPSPQELPGPTQQRFYYILQVLEAITKLSFKTAHAKGTTTQKQQGESGAKKEYTVEVLPGYTFATTDEEAIAQLSLKHEIRIINDKPRGPCRVCSSEKHMTFKCPAALKFLYPAPTDIHPVFLLRQKPGGLPVHSIVHGVPPLEYPSPKVAHSSSDGKENPDQKAGVGVATVSKKIADSEKIEDAQRFVEALRVAGVQQAADAKIAATKAVIDRALQEMDAGRCSWTDNFTATGLTRTNNKVKGNANGKVLANGAGGGQINTNTKKENVGMDKENDGGPLFEGDDLIAFD